MDFPLIFIYIIYILETFFQTLFSRLKFSFLFFWFFLFLDVNFFNLPGGIVDLSSSRYMLILLIQIFNVTAEKVIQKI